MLSSVVFNPWSGPITSHTHCVYRIRRLTGMAQASDCLKSSKPTAGQYPHTQTHSCSLMPASTRRGIRYVGLCQALGEREHFGRGITERADPDSETSLLLWDADLVLQISPRTLHCHSATSHKPDPSTNTHTHTRTPIPKCWNRKRKDKRDEDHGRAKLPLTLSETRGPPTLNLAWKVQQGWRREPAWKAEKEYMNVLGLGIGGWRKEGRN